MDLNNLTDEQKDRARNAKTPADIIALAEEEGYELSDDELELVSGGWSSLICNPDSAPKRDS